MNEELLYIELLSVADKIKKEGQKKDHRTIGFLFSVAIVVGLLFFGLSTIAYKIIYLRLRLSVYSIWLTMGYYFCLFVGCILLGILVFLLLYFLLQQFLINKQFDRWLGKKVKAILTYPIVYQDDTFFYLAKERTAIPNIRIKKETCSCLTESLDGYPVMLGSQVLFSKISINRLFMIKEEQSIKDKKIGGIHRVYSSIVIGILALIGAFYLTEKRMYQPLSKNETISETLSDKSEPILDSQQLLKQKGEAPKEQVSEATSLDWNRETDELYMTTDSGNNWQFVPLKPEWLRAGSYLLTSGEIPEGYWMEKSYALASAFSWFIYAPNASELYTLQSTDNGKTWTNSLVTKHLGRIRYRKATFYTEEAGTLIFSQETEMSEEAIQIFSTVDKGENWSQTGSTVIDQPIQNSSFLS